MRDLAEPLALDPQRAQRPNGKSVPCFSCTSCWSCNSCPSCKQRSRSKSKGLVEDLLLPFLQDLQILPLFLQARVELEVEAVVGDLEVF